MEQSNEELEPNQMQVPLLIFLRSYNKNLPAGFPRATTATLKEFQSTHPMLFKRGDGWSFKQHRKRVIDWLPSHRIV